MAVVTKTRTYVTSDQLTAGNYNADRDEIIAGVNSINNAQIASNAAISESKIAFSIASGHNHDGVDSRLISSASIDLSGLTAGQLIAVNGAGNALETRLVTSADISGTIPYVQLALTGQIVPADLDPTFVLPEAQVTFDTVSGHNHDGVNSAPITVALPRSYLFVDYQELIVEDNVGVNPIVEVDTAFDAIYAYVKEAPVGADIIVTITLTDLTPVATITIPDGQNFASAAVSATVPAGTFIQMNVTQVGSTTAGSYLTVTLSGLTA